MSNRIPLDAESDEVFYSREGISFAGPPEIEFLLDAARRNPRRRARICFHPSVGAPVHEMFIVHLQGAYVPPHKHLDRSESFHLVDGRVDVLLFEDDGALRQITEMGRPGAPLYYRIDEPVFHSLEVLSEFVLFHETTAGPFDRSRTVFPDWAPSEGDEPGIAGFRARLREQRHPR